MPKSKSRRKKPNVQQVKAPTKSFIDIVFFGTLDNNQKQELIKSHFNDKSSTLKGFRYFGFESFIGVHSRGLPIDFINKCLPHFSSIEELYKSIEKAFHRFYAYGINGIGTHFDSDPCGDIRRNLNKPTRWSLSTNEENTHYIMPLDLKPLYFSEGIENIKTYIMIDHNTGYYKIGKSKNPKFREKTLQSEKPTIEMIKIFNRDIEKQLHKEYKEHRIRGEWFSLSGQDINRIVSVYS